ncbi:hypothetical protein AYL99_11919 [Fonsecaea erecta]|uniref:Chromatin target of PRMT1 protein C-terminal domain-containing protein n=1 Tax=Fonsecaea erecta TaxID=1367422 RepID=A0A178Z2F3_9EURO|nr:hypothetical protein AYL99_11919 [Fonsecaea erecta]OAP53897.1 hypothetical protein AYL99_11919 [Fonsecaea erecta]
MRKKCYSHFSKPDSAAEAAKDLNGMLVDKRLMKATTTTIRTVHGSLLASTRLKLSWMLAVSQSRLQPITCGPCCVRKTTETLGKVRTIDKNQHQPQKSTKIRDGNSTMGRSAGKPGKPKRGRNPRAKPKTAEELDAEMTDYCGGNNPTAVGPTAEAAASNGATPISAPRRSIRGLGAEVEEVSVPTHTTASAVGTGISKLGGYKLWPMTQDKWDNAIPSTKNIYLNGVYAQDMQKFPQACLGKAKNLSLRARHGYDAALGDWSSISTFVTDSKLEEMKQQKTFDVLILPTLPFVGQITP